MNDLGFSFHRVTGNSYATGCIINICIISLHPVQKQAKVVTDEDIAFKKKQAAEKKALKAAAANMTKKKKKKK